MVDRPTRRRAVRIAVAALATVACLALAGCVGIPSSGGVNEGKVVQNTDDSPFAALAKGPQTNATQEEILTGFMQAATAPEGDYATARLFLTKKAATSWQPDKSVIIRNGAGKQTREGDDVIDYTVSTNASLNAFGVYTQEQALSQQDLTYNFIKVGKQWRISALPDGTVVTVDNFPVVFEQHALYYFDPTFTYLIPDVRWFAARSNVPTKTVVALLAGQASWLQQGGTLTAFPQGTQLASAVTSRSGVATVDLSDEAASASASDKARMRQQLEYSLGTPSLGNVAMTVRGAPLTVSDSTPVTAVTTPAVDVSPLVRRGNRFGFASGSTITSTKLSARILSTDPTAVTLGLGQATAAVRGKGGVYLVSSGHAQPILVDSRPNLIAPSIDALGYVWSVPAGDASAIHATGADGIVHDIASDLPPGATIVTLDVSREGSRVVVYLNTSAGPRLKVAAIIRRDGVPTALGQLLDLPVTTDKPIDATWLDDSTIAAIAHTAFANIVTQYPIGAPIQDLGRAEDGTQIVGGNGAEQLRVLTSKGEILQNRSSGWQSTGMTASVLATQQ